EPALTADLPSKRRLRARASRGLSHRARRADRAAARGYLEGVAEGGEVLAGVIILVGELRNAEVVRPRFLTLVDARIEIDEMPARLAGGLHDQLDIALAVEGAGVADIAVVVDQMNDIGGLAPAHALEVNAERGADRAAGDIERKRGGLDPIRAGFFLA